MDDAERARAEQLLALHRPAEAERLARTALGRDPHSAAAMEVLSEALRHQDRYEEAVEVARAGLGQDPTSGALLLGLIDSLVELAGGESVGAGAPRRRGAPLVQEARDTADRLVHLEPNLWVSHYARARALLAGDRPRVRDALESAQRAVRVAPHSADAHNLVGVCLDSLTHHDAARAAYEEALRLDPHHAQAMNNLATLDVGFFRLRKAARGFRDAASLAPGEGMAQQNLRMLTMRLAIRILVVVLVGAGILAITLATGTPWWGRALLGACLIGGTGWLVVDSRDHLPRGMTLDWRVLTGAMGWRERIWLGITVFALACLVAMSFAPAGVAADAGMGLLVIGRGLLFGTIVVGLLSAFRGLRRR